MGNNKRIAINSIVIFARLCIVSIIGLLSSRFVLQALGASDYGLYNVVGGLVIMLNVLNTSMITTTYRYIAYEMGKGGAGNPNKIFNTSLAIHVGLALFFVIVGGIIGLWYINNYLNVAPAKLADARFVFFLSLITMAINTIFIPHQGLVVALEKFSITAIFEIISRIVAFVGVVYLLTYSGNKLRLYSILMLIASAVQYFLIYGYTYLHSLSIIRFHFYRDRNLYKEMISFSGWILFGASASVGRSQGRAIIINYFFGTLVNAAYGIASQIESYVQMFARSLNQAAVPQITKSFSGGDKRHSEKLASYISKYTFILMSLAVFPLMLEVDFVLDVWLKEVPEGAALFCQLMMLGGLIGCMGEGIPALVQATGKIKFFQIIMSTISLLGLPIAIVFFALGAPAYFILIISCFTSLLNAVVRLVLLKRILNMNIMNFIKTSYLRMFYISCPLGVAYFLYDSSSYTMAEHVYGILALELLLVLSILFLGIDKDERRLVAQYIYNIRKKVTNEN